MQGSMDRQIGPDFKIGMLGSMDRQIGRYFKIRIDIQISNFSSLALALPSEKGRRKQAAAYL